MEEEGRKKIILASSSPRRRRILELLKLDFDIIEPKDYLERSLSNPYRTVVLNSSSKARNVYVRIVSGKEGKGLEKSYKSEFLVSGFDTIVYLKNKYFGKPSSKKQAEEYLNFFSGKSHLVISGVCVLSSLNGKYLYDTETTRVKFRKLSSVEIKEYIEKYMKAAAPAGKRMRIAKFLQNWVAGQHGVGTWQGGGPPDMGNVYVRRAANLEEKKKMAKELAGIVDD